MCIIVAQIYLLKNLKINAKILDYNETLCEARYEALVLNTNRQAAKTKKLIELELISKLLFR